MKRVQNLTDCTFNLFNLQPKNLRRYSHSAASKDYQLLRAVGSRDANAVFGAQFVRGFLDEHIGGFGFFGVHDGDISIFFHSLSLFTLYASKTRMRLHRRKA